MSHILSMSSCRLARLLGVACLVLLSAPALAQRGPGGGWRGSTEPQVTTESLEQMSEMLGLSEDQAFVVEEMHAGYLSEVQALADEVREVFDAARQEFRDTRDREVWRDLGEVMQRFGERRDDLTDALLSDVRLILLPEQEEQWAGVERYHRRYSSLQSDGLISGETVDLVDVVRTMDLEATAREQVDSLLAQYEVEFDRALIDRNRKYEEGLSQGPGRFFDGDVEEMEKLFEASRDAAIKLRDINRRYERQIGNSLDPEARAELEMEVNKRAFPQVYRKTQADETVSAALGMEDLTEAQRVQIADLRASYERELEAANARLAQEIARGEMERTVESFFRRRGGGDAEEVLAARDARRDVVERAVDRIRGVLTPEQAERLPERGESEDWRTR